MKFDNALAVAPKNYHVPSFIRPFFSIRAAACSERRLTLRASRPLRLIFAAQWLRSFLLCSRRVRRMACSLLMSWLW